MQFNEAQMGWTHVISLFSLWKEAFTFIYEQLTESCQAFEASWHGNL